MIFAEHGELRSLERVKKYSLGNKSRSTLPHRGRERQRNTHKKTGALNDMIPHGMGSENDQERERKKIEADPLCIDQCRRIAG